MVSKLYYGKWVPQSEGSTDSVQTLPDHRTESRSRNGSVGSLSEQKHNEDFARFLLAAVWPLYRLRNKSLSYVTRVVMNKIKNRFGLYYLHSSTLDRPHWSILLWRVGEDNLKLARNIFWTNRRFFWPRVGALDTIQDRIYNYEYIKGPLYGLHVRMSQIGNEV